MIPRYYAWLTSEYLVDDFTEVVRSELFADNVSVRLADQAIIVPAGLIQGSAATGQQHRIISLGFSGANEAEVTAIAGAGRGRTGRKQRRSTFSNSARRAPASR